MSGAKKSKKLLLKNNDAYDLEDPFRKTPNKKHETTRTLTLGSNDSS